MKTLIAAGTEKIPHVLAEMDWKSWPLCFCWFEDHGPHYQAKGRNDGLIYIGGFRTRIEAEAWGIKRGIMPAPNDEQGTQPPASIPQSGEQYPVCDDADQGEL